MNVKQLKEMLSEFDDDTEIIITGSWNYNQTVPGNVKSFSGGIDCIIDAVKIDGNIELYSNLKKRGL